MLGITLWSPFPFQESGKLGGRLPQSVGSATEIALLGTPEFSTPTNIG